MRLGGKRFHRIVPSAQHVADPGDTSFHHNDGGDAIARAHAANIKSFFDVIGILHPAPEPGDLLRAIGDRVAHPGFVQAGQGGSRRHSTHRRDGTFDAAVATSYGFMSKRDYETATDIVAKDYRSQ